MTEPCNILNLNLSNTDQCSICYGKLLEDEQVYILPECGHCYHTDCIIAWFRMKNSEGRCPMCGNVGSNKEQDSAICSYYTKFKLISRHIKRKEIPNWLKSDYKKYKKLEYELITHKKKVKSCEKDNSLNYIDGCKLMKKMREKQFSLEDKIRRERRMLATIPIVPLFIPQIKKTAS